AANDRVAKRAFVLTPLDPLPPPCQRCVQSRVGGRAERGKDRWLAFAEHERDIQSFALAQGEAAAGVSGPDRDRERDLGAQDEDFVSVVAEDAQSAAITQR